GRFDDVDTDSDAALIAQAQSGDADAFGRLVTRYMRQAYFSALGFVGSPEDARDLSQEAFARAFRAREAIDPDRPFFAWYYTILRRLCLNWRRNRRTERLRLDEAGPWLESLATAGTIPPDRQVHQDEARRRVARALALLGDEEREALVLKEFEGLKYREIA